MKYIALFLRNIITERSTYAHSGQSQNFFVLIVRDELFVNSRILHTRIKSAAF